MLILVKNQICLFSGRKKTDGVYLVMVAVGRKACWKRLASVACPLFGLQTYVDELSELNTGRIS